MTRAFPAFAITKMKGRTSTHLLIPEDAPQQDGESSLSWQNGASFW